MIRIPSPAALTAVIRGLVADSGLSHRAFAAHVSVTPKQIDKWLSGENLPNSRSMLLIGEALGYDLALVPRENA